MKHHNYEADFLFGCFAKIYGTIKSLVLGNSFPQIYRIPQFSRCAFDLTAKILQYYRIKALRLVTVCVANTFCCYSNC